MIRDRKRNKKRERGASLVEFAIAATVFLTVVFAVVEFGRALWVHNAVPPGEEHVTPCYIRRPTLTM